VKRGLALAAAALAALLARPVPADACSCDGWHDVLPADGATDVPLGAAIIAAVVITGELTLRDAGGADVPLTPETIATHAGGMVRYQPDAPLAPDATYRVFVGGLEVSQFQTGATTDAIAPTLPSLDLGAWNAAIVAGTDNTCQQGDRYAEATLDFAATGADYYLIAFSFDFVEVRRYGIAASRVAELADISTVTCGVAPPDVEVLWCAKVIAVDHSGNETTVENCVQPRLCEAIALQENVQPDVVCDPLGDAGPWGGDAGNGDGDGGGCCHAGGTVDGSFFGFLLALGLARIARTRMSRSRR
jgi:hypothetical protein